jgi:hypothetical protein
MRMNRSRLPLRRGLRLVPAQARDPMAMLLLLLAAARTAAIAAGSASCQGELLYNGICLPEHQWPPLWTGGPDAPLPRHDGADPSTFVPYLKDPPAQINVTIGRQLFVDPFLIESIPGLQLLNHAAEWEGQVLRATEEWEASATVPQSDWPQNSRAIGYANPFSGGVWWDEQHVPKPSYRAWYVCGGEAESGPTPVQPGCCYAESPDGRHWSKPAVGTGNATGTNIVLQESFDGNVVWLDHEAKSPDERWLMATIPKNLGYSMYHILSSPDGVHWTSRRNSSGSLQDRSTFFKNPFRDKWIYSLKQGWPAPYGRSRAYREGSDFIADADWNSSAVGGDGPTPWTSADAADPPFPCETTIFPMFVRSLSR